jgi:hypothetical protein
MIYFFLSLHYALVKGIYTKRWKNGFISSVAAFSFFCIFILFLFTVFVFIDKQLLWDIIRKRVPLGPLTKGVLLLIVPLFFVL